ncbi:MAG TPA: phage baseplate assembly protein V [Actinopolymorphaceae bacterium]
MTATTASLANSRVVPQVRLRLGGSDVDDDTLRCLGPVRVSRALSVPTACELELIAPPSATTFELGTELEVRVAGHDTALFGGSVVALEDRFGADGVHRLRVRAHDAAHELRATGGVRTHVDTDVAGIAGELFGGTGLSVHAASDGPHWPRLLQRGESDLAFFTTTCRQAGMWWQVVDDRLELLSMPSGTDADVRELTWGLDLLEASVTRCAVTSTDTVKVSGWDLLTATRIQGTADSDAIDGGTAARTSTLTGRAFAGADAADALADYTIGLASAAGGVLSAVVIGDPDLRPGVAVRIVTSGVAGAAMLTDSHLLTAVDHLIDDASGFVSVLSSAPPPEPAGTDLSSESLSVTLGMVVGVDDPTQSGRVRVTLPAYDDVETDWLPVLALGAGPDKGLDCQPDVGDLVLLTHVPGNPTAAIVLGGLHGDRTPAEGAGVGDGGVRRYGMRTPDGQVFVLDRDTDGVRLTNQAGSTVRIDDTGIVVHSAGELTLEAPGHALRLRAATIDLEQA